MQCALQAAKEDDHALEADLGFPLFKEGEDQLGWLMNVVTVRAAPQETELQGKCRDSCSYFRGRSTARTGMLRRPGNSLLKPACCQLTDGSLEFLLWVVFPIAFSFMQKCLALLHSTVGKLPWKVEEKHCWSGSLLQTSLDDKESGQVLSAVSCYFMCQVGLEQLCRPCQHAVPALTPPPSPSCGRPEVAMCGQTVHSVRELQLRHT